MTFLEFRNIFFNFNNYLINASEIFSSGKTKSHKERTSAFKDHQRIKKSQ